MATVTFKRDTGESESTTVPDSVPYVVVRAVGLPDVELYAPVVAPPPVIPPVAPQPAPVQLFAQVGDPVWIDLGANSGLFDFGDTTAKYNGYGTRPAWVSAHVYGAQGVYHATFGGKPYSVTVTARTPPRVPVPAGADLGSLFAKASGPTTFVLAPGATYATSVGFPIRQWTEIIGDASNPPIIECHPGTTSVFANRAPLLLRDLRISGVGSNPGSPAGKYGYTAIHPSSDVVAIRVTFVGIDCPIVQNVGFCRAYFEDCTALSVGGNIWIGGLVVVHGGTWSSNCEPMVRSSEPATNGATVFAADITGTPDGVKEPISFRIGKRCAAVGNTTHGRIVVGEGAPAPGQSIDNVLIVGNTVMDAPRPDPAHADAAPGFINIRSACTHVYVVGNVKPDGTPATIKADSPYSTTLP